VADIYLGSLLKARENQPKVGDSKEKAELTVSTDQLKNLSGDYWSEELGVVYRLGVSDGRIKVLSMADASGAPRVNNFSSDALRAVGSDEFEAGKSGVTFHFRHNANGSAPGFILDAGRTTGIAFNRK
jgi:hypothetical protein